MINLRQHPKNLVLASASPRRSELLQRMGLPFTVRPADIPELDAHLDGPARMVLLNAAMKAEKLSAAHPESLVLGSDTTVVIDDVILGKPVDMEAACAMLQMLSGRAHTVFTAVALRWEAGDFLDDFVESSQVRFRALDAAGIRAYFDLVNPLDKAGAYGIQEGRELIIEAVEGSVENVMGLPIQALQAHLDAQGFNFNSSDG
jgi:septum formation protein|tara:strand:- start:3257 stop:3865 length:609 start_codon:yes stop_codon:yes gene_type:complete